MGSLSVIQSHYTIWSTFTGNYGKSPWLWLQWLKQRTFYMAIFQFANCKRWPHDFSKTKTPGETVEMCPPVINHVYYSHIVKHLLDPSGRPASCRYRHLSPKLQWPVDRKKGGWFGGLKVIENVSVVDVVANRNKKWINQCSYMIWSFVIRDDVIQ